MIECRTMASAERYDAFALMEQFRTDTAALGEALSLFIDRPDFGFVWLAYLDDHPAACASASLGIDTATGGLLATVRDLFVPPERRRHGIGSALLVTLQGRLKALDVTRIEAVCGTDPSLLGFFEARGYRLNSASFTLRP
ncbi:MAG: GNAT family N-acetyltransferase [Candidatus Lustribacter sp.]|jgi:GNAT superfamily N-acetyltransferase